MNINLLQELRYISTEVSYESARRMPVEVRRWWIDEMQKEAQAREDQIPGGKRTVPVK